MDSYADRATEATAIANVGRIPSSGAIRDELRHATADIHDGLHRHRGFALLMRGRLAMPAYSALLARLYGFHYPLERKLGAGPHGLAGPIDLAAREKSHLLRADLTTVGMSQQAIDALPLCGALPDLGSTGHIVGCLYVVEGAGLGGRVIARRLDYLLGPEVQAGRRFFLGRPDPDPLPWRLCCDILERYAQAGHGADIVGSARRTFEAINGWLSGGGGDV